MIADALSTVRPRCSRGPISWRQPTFTTAAGVSRLFISSGAVKFLWTQNDVLRFRAPHGPMRFGSNADLSGTGCCA